MLQLYVHHYTQTLMLVFFVVVRFQLDIMDDPSVPTRERIKALSAKLVELNFQEDV